ncbi:hypothetical protein K438DRAFT_1840534 [Mycena galopus ATCC 62051]|nr:hypothetical protein K438DRAFT_1840534 [Mycena galopus ATCC 62051]
MPPPLIHRTSDVSHVSDSEPEREALRCRCRCRSLEASSPTLPESPTRPPLSTISNTTRARKHTCCPNFGSSSMEFRLCAMELAISGMREDVARAISVVEPGGRKRLRSPSLPSPSTPPPPKKYRSMKIGSDSPIGRLDEPRIHRSSLLLSTPEREENSREAHQMLRDLRGERELSLPNSRSGTTARKRLRRRVASGKCFSS